ncbi:DEAD/DEAH box helicase family protein [Erysipelotrichaceae bacterium 51-3]
MDINQEKDYLQEIQHLYNLLEAHQIPVKKPEWVLEAMNRVFSSAAYPPQTHSSSHPENHSSSGPENHPSSWSENHSSLCADNRSWPVHPSLESSTLNDPAPSFGPLQPFQSAVSGGLPKGQSSVAEKMNGALQGASAISPSFGKDPLTEKEISPIPAVSASTRPDLDLFASYFKGRPDHFYCIAKSGAMYVPCTRDGTSICPKTSPSFVWKPGVSPCKNCKYKENQIFNRQVLAAYFSGRPDIPYNQLRICPFLANGTTSLMVFDFARLEDLSLERQKGLADKLQKTAVSLRMDGLKVVNADGKAVTLWFFLEQPIEAAKVIELGQILILRAIEQEALDELRVFDCVIPNKLPNKPGDPGWSMELPLHMASMKQGRTLWLDENWNPKKPDVWTVLKQTSKISLAQIDQLIKASRKENLKSRLELRLPQTMDETSQSEKGFEYAETLFDPYALDAFLFERQDIEGKMQIHLTSGIEIETSNLKDGLRMALLMLGSCWNPEYAGKNTRFVSGPHVLSSVHFQGDRIVLPRGSLQVLVEQLEQAQIDFELSDETIAGPALPMNFGGELREEQTGLVDALAQGRCGILEAATGAGKTVMGAALIAEKKTSALVLVNSREILSGWVRTLNEFLAFEDEEFEQFKISSTKYPGKIGVLQSSTKALTGRVDVAMIPSLTKREDLDSLLERYGLILFDECHHAASPVAQTILEATKARYVYGFSATPKRNDGLFAKVYWQLGPVVSQFTARDQMARQTFSRAVTVRPTPFSGYGEDLGGDFTRITQQASLDPERNARILEDVLCAVDQGRTVLVLTRFVEHARMLARTLESIDSRLNLLVYAGDPKEKAANQEKLHELAGKDHVVLVGTYSSIGEGFDFPPLDTLMLALPIRSQVSISQAIGRIHRQTASKKQVLVYDYLDEQIPMLNNMYAARKREYEKQGYEWTLPLKQTRSFPEVWKPKEYAGQKALASLGQDLQNVQARVAFATRQILPEEENCLFALLARLDSRNRKIRVDLFVETIENDQSFRLQSRGIHIHVHERIVENCLILDQTIVWYGRVLQLQDSIDLEAAGFGVWRLENAQFANDLLTLRRKEELRLLKKQQDERTG